MTKEEIVRLIQFNIGREDIKEEVMTLWLNGAIDVINSEDIEFPDMLHVKMPIDPLEQGKFKNMIPDDFNKLLALELDKFDPLAYKSFKSFMHLFNENRRGRPLIFTMNSAQFFYYPVADRDYRVFLTYYKKIPYIRHADEEFALAKDSMLIVEQATIQALQSLDDGSESHNILIRNWIVRYVTTVNRIKQRIGKINKSWKGGQIVGGE